jgi:transposase
LEKIAESCRKRKQKLGSIERRVGRLLGANTRAAGLFDVKVKEGKEGKTEIFWQKIESWRQWAELSEGYYMLRTNIKGWKVQDIWEAYIQLTQAETAFRINKSDLKIWLIWHQKEERVKAHNLVCFLAYVLWKMLGQMCKKAGLGNEPRKITAVQTYMPTCKRAPKRMKITVRRNGRSSSDFGAISPFSKLNRRPLGTKNCRLVNSRAR